jgi:hypothetical protein
VGGNALTEAISSGSRLELGDLLGVHVKREEEEERSKKRLEFLSSLAYSGGASFERGCFTTRSSSGPMGNTVGARWEGTVGNRD